MTPDPSQLAVLQKGPPRVASFSAGGAWCAPASTAGPLPHWSSSSRSSSSTSSHGFSCGGALPRQRKAVSSAVAAALATYMVGRRLRRLPGLVQRRSFAVEAPTQSRVETERAEKAVLHSKIEELKEQLRRAPTKASVAALERSWSPEGAELQPAQLRGAWRLDGPEDNRLCGWTSGDLPRMLLELYTGFGRSLDMQLISTPLLRISGDGQTLTRTRLRWGRGQDVVLLRGELATAGPGRLREVPHSVQSSALGLTLPALQSVRDIRVTFYDGELLILRDDRGVIDLLWKQDRVEAPPAAEPPGVASEETMDNAKLSHVVGELERLKDVMEDLRGSAVKDHAEREQLMEEVSGLEVSLETATVNSQAYEMKLDVMKRLLADASEATDGQRHRSEEKLRLQKKLEAEVTSLQHQAADLEQRMGCCRAGEASLHAQISALEEELQVGPRESWPACRAALSTARGELKAVQRELRVARKSVAALARGLGRKSRELGRRAREAQVEFATRGELEEQLHEHHRELDEQKEHLSKVTAVEQALHEQLGDVRAKLSALETREAEGRHLAAAVEREAAELLPRVADARRAARELNTGEKPRKFWPWR
mmetsp:Transcript_41247/g.119256  ORF Transcript_41247/g.119256 Transcript_41247/m.119256 type:complete len:599 (+) Transcript_41247:41-1837(+)